MLFYYSAVTIIFFDHTVLSKKAAVQRVKTWILQRKFLIRLKSLLFWYNIHMGYKMLRSAANYNSTEGLQLNEINKNGEMRVTGKWARALRISSHPRMCRNRRSAAVIERGLQYCSRNIQRSVHSAMLLQFCSFCGRATRAIADHLKLPHTPNVARDPRTRQPCTTHWA